MSFRAIQRTALAPVLLASCRSGARRLCRARCRRCCSFRCLTVARPGPVTTEKANWNERNCAYQKDAPKNRPHGYLLKWPHKVSEAMLMPLPFSGSASIRLDSSTLSELQCCQAWCGLYEPRGLIRLSISLSCSSEDPVHIPMLLSFTRWRQWMATRPTERCRGDMSVRSDPADRGDTRGNCFLAFRAGHQYRSE
jgi:hypothetical protein